MNSTHSNPDDFRIVDLFSPSETSFAPPAPEGAGQKYPSPPRMSGELPESFLFANPFFAPNRSDERHR